MLQAAQFNTEQILGLASVIIGVDSFIVSFIDTLNKILCTWNIGMSHKEETAYHTQSI